MVEGDSGACGAGIARRSVFDSTCLLHKAFAEKRRVRGVIMQDRWSNFIVPHDMNNLAS